MRAQWLILSSAANIGFWIGIFFFPGFDGQFVAGITDLLPLQFMIAAGFAVIMLAAAYGSWCGASALAREAGTRYAWAGQLFAYAFGVAMLTFSDWMFGEGIADALLAGAFLHALFGVGFGNAISFVLVALLSVTRDDQAAT